MASTLVIGIGTTGLKVIEEAQQYHYEFTGKNKPGANTSYMYIETDLNKTPRKTASGETNIDQVGLSLGNIQVAHKQLTENTNLDTEWIPSPEGILENEIGAGGMPAFGRLAFWSNANYQNLRSTISSKYQEINIKGESTNVLIVGSLTGGTGAGICVDLAYLVKDTLQISSLNAILLLPDLNSYSTNKALHVNAFSALSAIEHYSKSENTYKITWPDGSNFQDVGSPFQICHFMSQDFSNSNASIPSEKLGELLKVAGMKTMLHFASTNVKGNHFTDVLEARRVDRAGSDRLSTMNSTGFYMIQYPKAQLQELLSIKICSSLIEQLTDDTNYINNAGTKKNISTDKIIFENQSKKMFEDILLNILEELDSTKTQDELIIPQSFEKDVNTIISKKHGKKDKLYIFEKFCSTNESNYYQLIKSNSSIIRDQLINNIDNVAKNSIEKYKNISIAKLHIESITKHLSNLIEFYLKRYNVKGTEENWNTILGRNIDEFFSSLSEKEFTLQKSSYLKHIFNELSFLLKINILIPELKKIQNDLMGQESITSLQNTYLPNIGLFDDIQNKMLEVNSGEGSESNMTLKRRKGELDNYLDQFSSCFKMVYTSGVEQDVKKGEKKAQDLEKAYKEYEKGQKLTFNDIFGEKIWSFFSNESEKIYSTVIKNSMNHMKSQSFFTGHSLVSILKQLDDKTVESSNLKKLFNANKEYIKNNFVPAMVKLKSSSYAFGNDEYSKLVVVSSDHLNYGTLFDNYKFGSDSNSVDIEELRDVIIFYQEYSYLGDVGDIGDVTFVPTRHLANITDLKTYIKGEISKNKKYSKKKFPYFSEDQLKKLL